MELMINQVVYGSFYEIPKIWGLENFQVGDHIHMVRGGGGDTPQLHGNRITYT